MSTKAISQKKINVFIFIIFTIAVILAVLSTLYIHFCNKAELEIEQYKNQCEELSQQLVEKSSYLTEEVRNFVINQDMEALHNYWDEIEQVKTRENVIAQLEEMELPIQEMRLLNVAKENSDLYSYTESRAMRLVLDTMNVDESWLPSQVQDYVLNVVEKEMTDEAKKTAALQLLFSRQYIFEKETIMNNVELFQQTMQKRLEGDLDRAKRMSSQAMGILFILLGIILGMVFLILLIFVRMVIRPIQIYSDTLHDNQNMEYPLLSPQGSRETQIFAETFNELLAKLQEAGAAKSTFVSTMSHEIRTPLNTITGCEYLLRDTGLSGRQKEYMGHIQIASKQLLQIVNNVLDYSKLEQNRYQVELIDFNIRELCEEVCQLLYPTAKKKGIYLKLSMNYVEYPYIKGDEGKIRQILINLISNGIKFTSQGGVKITVKTHETGNSKVKNTTHNSDWSHSVNEQVSSSQIEPGIQLIFHVEDTGIGIEDEQKSVIFNAFEQADATVSRKYGGTGLGLAITDQIIHLLKGTIQLESQIGRGSIFTVCIPLQKSIQKEVEAANNGVIQPIYEGVRVLLVDDDEINQRMEGEILKKFGLKVDFASNGEESVIKASEICYDIIFMDIRMSKVDGYEAAKAIRQEGRSSSMIVALSADAEEKAIKKAYEAGMEAYLTKPLVPGRIASILELALRKGCFGKEPSGRGANDAIAAADAEVIALLQASLDEGVLNSMNILVENKKIIWNLLGQDNYEKLEYAIQSYDWDAALYILGKEV